MSRNCVARQIVFSEVTYIPEYQALAVFLWKHAPKLEKPRITPKVRKSVNYPVPFKGLVAAVSG